MMKKLCLRLIEIGYKLRNDMGLNCQKVTRFEVTRIEIIFKLDPKLSEGDKVQSHKGQNYVRNC